MIHEEIYCMIEEMDFPFAYHHFAEGEAPDLPFLIYLFPETDNFAADNCMYYEIKRVHIELYTDKKDLVAEERIEEVLKDYKIFYNKSETWIESESMYEVLYTMEV